jgi:hypothetical protein
MAVDEAIWCASHAPLVNDGRHCRDSLRTYADNDPTLTDAILDRIVHSSHKIKLEATKSMRDTVEGERLRRPGRGPKTGDQVGFKPTPDNRPTAARFRLIVGDSARVKTVPARFPSAATAAPIRRPRSA